MDPEGTWEEIMSHAEELAGHRVKVIVLDEGQASSPDRDADSLYERLKDRVGQVSFLSHKTCRVGRDTTLVRRLRGITGHRRASVILCDASPLVALINKASSAPGLRGCPAFHPGATSHHLGMPDRSHVSAWRLRLHGSSYGVHSRSHCSHP